MRYWLACCTLVLLIAVNGATAQTAVDLTGLWVAKERYGPDIRGTLLILPRNGGLVADLAGFSIPIMQSGTKISFAVPGSKAHFRGTRSGREIVGQWIQAPAVSSGIAYATPIVLRPDRLGHWRGEIVPADDHVTYYLPLTQRSGGGYATYLRNPERNQGIFLGATRLEQDGDIVRLIGTSRGQKDEAVIGNGRVDLDNGLLAIAIEGVTFNFTRDTSESSAFYPRGKSPERYRYSPPVPLDDGWPVSTLDKADIDRAAMETFVQKLIDMPMDGLSSSQIHSLLIARHGKLVLEEYFHGYDRDTPHDTRSGSKSWTNVLIGAAMQAGVPIRLDTPVYRTMLGQVPADLDPRKQAMTLEHLISMTAGFDCDDSGDRPGDEDVMQQQSQEPDWYRYTLNVAAVSAPGEKIVYCSAKPNLAAGMLEKIAGEPLPEMFYRLVAKPLHMSHYHLFMTPTGTAYGGGGHRFTTRDFMKLAQLLLNDGSWQGRQIVSREWVQKSSAALRQLSPTQSYGYLWNSVEYPYRGRKVHAFFAAGNGGQVYMGIPDLDLLIAFTGGNYADRVLFRVQRNFVPEDILPAVYEGGVRSTPRQP